jgi:hypothetical protein
MEEKEKEKEKGKRERETPLIFREILTGRREVMNLQIIFLPPLLFAQPLSP